MGDGDASDALGKGLLHAVENTCKWGPIDLVLFEGTCDLFTLLNLES